MLYSPHVSRRQNRLPAALSSLLRRLAVGLARARTRRRQRIALTRLLELDPATLDDIGVDRMDVLEAIGRQQRMPVQYLEVRRLQRQSPRFLPGR